MEDRFRERSRKRKVRTPQGAMPDNLDSFRIHPGDLAERQLDGKCRRKENRPTPFRIGCFGESGRILTKEGHYSRLCRAWRFRNESGKGEKVG